MVAGTGTSERFVIALAPTYCLTQTMEGPNGRQWMDWKHARAYRKIRETTSDRTYWMWTGDR